ncbi:phage major capsid protein [Novosphingobium tardum]|uniref:Phage major capsid protein n=1 Tax=Novosphingobium tardum TaxID=1538021 RepID=A0ABV8RQS4_9SPHN
MPPGSTCRHITLKPTTQGQFKMHKSIQEAREKIAANTGKLRAFDGEFFDSLQSRFDKLSASSQHPADFRRLSTEVRNYANQVANRDDWNSDVHGPIYDGLMAWIDAIDISIENRAVARDALGMGLEGESSRGAWRDAKTGAAIKLHSPADRVGNSAAPRVGMGELLEGMFFGPKTDAVRNALESGTDSAGGYSVPLEISRDFIDRLRAKSVFVQAGARTVMLDGPTRIVRLDQDPTATWRAENASIGDSDVVLSAVDLEPKSLSTLVKVPYELLADSTNVADILARATVQALAVELDRASLFGSGTSNEPAGLFTTSNINSVSMGTNGATPSSGWDEWLDMLYELELDNASAPSAAIWHPRTARTYRKMKDANSNPLTVPSPIDTLPKLSTTSVPINQDQGTATGICSTVLMGDFTQAILGMREQIQIIRLDQTFAANGQIGFWARLRADVGFAHGQSFCKLIGVKA